MLRWPQLGSPFLQNMYSGSTPRIRTQSNKDSFYLQGLHGSQPRSTGVKWQNRIKWQLICYRCKFYRCSKMWGPKSVRRGWRRRLTGFLTVDTGAEERGSTWVRGSKGEEVWWRDGFWVSGVEFQFNVRGVLGDIKERDDKLRGGNGEFCIIKHQLCRRKQSLQSHSVQWGAGTVWGKALQA